MTEIKANLDDLRATAASLKTTATSVEDRYNDLYSTAKTLDLPRTRLLGLPGYVESLRDEASFLSAKADWLEIVNTGDDGTAPTGTVTYEIPSGLKDPTNLASMEHWLGQAIADTAEDLTASDYKENDPRMEALHRQMERWKDDENVMSSMYTDLGPEGVLALTRAVGVHAYLAPNQASEEETETAKTLLTDIKGGLAAATNSWPSSQAQEFGRRLVNSAREHYQNEDSDIFGSTSQTDALNWLLYNNTDASNAFILGVAEKMDEIQQQDNAQGISDGWSCGPLSFLSSVVDEADRIWMFDTPSVVLHALGDHGQAAYQFFNGNEYRLTYWPAEHDYSNGDYSGIAAALDAASTTPAVMSNDPAGAGTIASYGVNGLMGRDDIGPYLAKDPSGHFKFSGVQGTETTSSMEHILENYLFSVGNSYANNGGDREAPKSDDDEDGVPDQLYTIYGPAGEAMPSAPWFGTDALNKALGLIGRDPQSMLNMRTSVSNAETQGITPGMNDESLKSTIMYWAGVEGALSNAIGTGAIDDAEARDECAQAWIELGSTGADQLTDMAQGKGAPNVAGLAADEFTDLLANKAKDSWASNTSDETKRQTELADRALFDYRLRMLFACDQAGMNGYQERDADGNLTQPLDEAAGAAAVEQSDGSYRLITADEFNALPEDERSTVAQTLNSLANSPKGLGAHMLTSNIEDTFNTEFLEKF